MSEHQPILDAIDKQGEALDFFVKSQRERFDKMAADVSGVTDRIEHIEARNALGDFASELRLLRLLRSLSDLPSVFGDSRSHGAA